MIEYPSVKLPRLNLHRSFGIPEGAGTEVTRYARVGLDILVVINCVAQVVLVLVLLMGSEGAQVAPIAGGATVALFLLMYFYGRWMFPFLKGWHILIVILLKEVGVFALLAFAVGVTMLVRWLAG